MEGIIFLKPNLGILKILKRFQLYLNLHKDKDGTALRNNGVTRKVESIRGCTTLGRDTV